MSVTVTTKQPDLDKSGANVVREKADRLLAERAELQERLRGNAALLRDAVAAGRLFGIEIEVPDDMRSAFVVGSHHGRSNLQQPNREPTLFESKTADVTIRDAVLDMLKQVGGKGAKAATLRRAVESMLGRQLHFKTIGMTLYRLSEKGMVRRQGIVWFYVPQGQTKTPAS